MAKTKAKDIILDIPISFLRQGARKTIIAPKDALNGEEILKFDDTIIKALLRAHRWKKALESGKADSIADLAQKEGISSSYFARVMRLNLLAPDIKTAILDGRQPKHIKLLDMLQPFPMLWHEQRKWFGFSQATRHPE